HDSERLVDLDEVNILRLEAKLAERQIDGLGWSRREPLGCLRDAAIADDARERCEPVLLHRSFARENEGACAVIDGRGVGGRDGSIFREGGLERCDLRWIALRGAFIELDDQRLSALLLRHGNRDDLRVEMTFLLGCERAAEALFGPLVLCFARDLV